MQKGSAIKLEFDKAANSYDNWYSSRAGKMYDRFEKKAFDELLANYHGGKKLLEIGCGTGHWSEYFADNGFEVTGVDVSESMMKKAKEKQIPNTAFQVADGRKLPFEDDAFNVVSAVTVLEFSSDAEKILSEMVRCVKKNGTILLGLLNSLNSYNQKRSENPSSVFSSAKMYNPGEINEIASNYGQTNIRVTGFVPENEKLIWLSPIYNFLNRFFRNKKGAFIALRISL